MALLFFGIGMKTDLYQVKMDWGKRLLEGTKKPCVPQDSGERSGDLTRDWTRLACEYSGVSSWGVGWEWPAAGSGTLTAAVLGVVHGGISPFGGGHHNPTIVWSQAKLRWGNRAPYISKIGLKIYWAWPCPPEQDPVFPTASPFHQEASTSLLSSSIRGQTEWKAQSQKTNQTYYMDHSHD